MSDTADMNLWDIERLRDHAKDPLVRVMAGKIVRLVAERDALLAVARAAKALNEKYLPKVNNAKSALDADAIAALNEFGIAIGGWRE